MFHSATATAAAAPPRPAAAGTRRRAVDVVVLGSSLHAYAAAYLLARRGKRTVLVDSATPQQAPAPGSRADDLVLHLPASTPHLVKCVLLVKIGFHQKHGSSSSSNAVAAVSEQQLRVERMPPVVPACCAARPQRHWPCGVASRRSPARATCCTCAAASTLRLQAAGLLRLL